jgi:hypothetical protein
MVLWYTTTKNKTQPCCPTLLSSSHSLIKTIWWLQEDINLKVYVK